MPVAFKLKIKHQGASYIDQYTGANGQVFAEKIAGAIEQDVISVAGQSLLEAAEISRERTLFLAAVFFQRVVSRTPIDEDYYFMRNGKEGSLSIHHKDDDVIRDYWTASYNNRKITAGQFRAAGMTFDTFNDEGEIREIYKTFRKAFIQNKGKNVKSVNIFNTHERFPMLEYGEYRHDGDIKRGEKYYHGVEGGYSVQAPHGMLRITEAEFQTMSLNMSTEKLIKEYVQRSQRIKKVPSSSKMKELEKIVMKGHVNEDDLSVIERLYK